MDISIIGGTGDEGFGLTLRLARAGHHITIGSRSQEKGAVSAEKAAFGGRAWHVVRPWHGSAAEQAKAILDPGVRMVGAFHTISGEALQDLEHEMESDVLVCGTDKEAKAIVGGLIEDIPRLRWVDAGDLTQARIAETLTALLISINRAYKIHDAGVRITGRDAWGTPGASA